MFDSTLGCTDSVPLIEREPHGVKMCRHRCTFPAQPEPPAAPQTETGDDRLLERKGESVKFLTNVSLPQYLEDALAPFCWSGIFSSKFRDSFIAVILAANREDVMPPFVESLRVIKFLDAEYVEQLSTALLRFAKEGFPKP